MLFEWVFRLHEKSLSKSSDMLARLIADFLNSINDRSLYYNTLTYLLLISKRRYGSTIEQRSEKIIDKVFEYGVELSNFATKITDVFFNMFSL